MRAKFSRGVIGPWFVTGKSAVRTYKDGRILCVANEDATGQIYYPNGRVAVSVEKGGADGSVTRIVLKTPGGIGRDGITRRPRLCGIFDSLGSGVVYDEGGKKIVFDQNQGYLRQDGTVPVHWRWHNLQYVGSRTTVAESAYPGLEHRTPKDPAAVAVIKRMVWPISCFDSSLNREVNKP